MANLKKWAKSSQARQLSQHEKHTIALLGLPTFGLALAVTVVVTYVPLIAKQYTTSNTLVGALIATEGIAALILPVVVGSVSDHLRTPINGRLPFVIAATPVATAALVLLSFVHSLPLLIICGAIFFSAYYVAYEPYRALYPDLVADDIAGRAQSVQGLWRGIGTGIALVAGGFLFAINNWLPFVASAVLFLLVMTIFVAVLLFKYGVPHQHHREPESIKTAYLNVIQLLKHAPLRNFMIANTLWELTLAALKSFILLYLTMGLDLSKVKAAAVISVTAVIIFIAAPLSGRLADTFGNEKIMKIAIATFGFGLLVPLFITHAWVGVIVLPVVAFGGAVVLTLPYALLIPMMPKGEYGRLTGIYSTSRGIGIMLGPLIAGAAISLTKNTFTAHGYSAMWLVCAVAMLASLFFLRKISE